MVTASGIVAYLNDLGHRAEVQINPEAEAVTVAHYTAEGPYLSWVKSKIVDVVFRGGILIAEPGAGAQHVTLRSAAGIVTTPNARLAFALVATEFFRGAGPGKVLQRGKDVQIHETAVVGCAGQGYVWNPVTKCYVPMPHFYGVILENGVDIGPCATICRGVLHDTVIGQGSKIGNHVNIGHGTRVGKHCLIVAHATVGGSVTIGDHVKIWQGAMIRNGGTIGDGADIGMGSIVTRDVAPGEVVRRFTE